MMPIEFRNRCFVIGLKTQKQIAHNFGKSQRQIIRWCSSGNFPAYVEAMLQMLEQEYRGKS